MELLSFKLLTLPTPNDVMLNIRHRHLGKWGETLFQGTVEELHTPPYRELHDHLDPAEVTFIEPEGNGLIIGVEWD